MWFKLSLLLMCITCTIHIKNIFRALVSALWPPSWISYHTLQAYLNLYLENSSGWICHLGNELSKQFPTTILLLLGGLNWVVLLQITKQTEDMNSNSLLWRWFSKTNFENLSNLVIHKIQTLVKYTSHRELYLKVLLLFLQYAYV